MKIDNFALSTHQSCPAKYDLRIRQGWQSRRRSGALGFGGAFHAGLAEWYKTGDKERGIQAIKDAWDGTAPVDDYRTQERCITTFTEYVARYPEESWKIVRGPSGPLVEIAFTLDTGMFCDCDLCGGLPSLDGLCIKCLAPCEPIEYGGIFDGLVEFGQQVYVIDHKTTSMMGNYYFDQFKPNNQMTGYVWGARALSGREVGGAIINAICVRKTGKTEFARQITTRTETEIQRWLQDVRSTCNEIRYHERTGHWPYRTISCTQYGKCEFYDVHTLSTKREQDMRLEQDFIYEPWDYESRDEAGRASLPVISNDTPQGVPR